MREDSGLDKHYLWERDKKKGVEKKERAYTIGGGVYFLAILKSKACLCTHTAANAHLHMPAGLMFHSLAH